MNARVTGWLTAEDLHRAKELSKTGDSRIRSIAAEVCAATDVPLREMMGKTRRVVVCRSRWLAWYIAHREGFSYSEIGRQFRRHHATIMHGVSIERKKRGEA